VLRPERVERVERVGPAPEDPYELHEGRDEGGASA
jgi:hypothetical protein